MNENELISANDRTVLRELARRVAEIASLPVMEHRRKLWKLHNALIPARPMILLFPEGSWDELLPPSSFACQGERARRIELDLRMRIYEHEHFDHDKPVEGSIVVNKVIHDSGWGIEARWHWSSDAGGARGFDPIIAEPSDLAKFKTPVLTYDEKATARDLAMMKDVFADILEVKLRGVQHISYHLLNQYTALRGLEQVMMDMIENPQMLHDALAILEAGHHSRLKQLMDQNLLSLNNDETYHSTGGVGYSDELPKAGFDPQRVRPWDMWSSAESQELAQVSPQMHAEFLLPYEKRLVAPFGLNGYGCCEDLTRKLDDVFQIPNIRRISISPWADVDACAPKMGGKYIFSWKPHPAHLAGTFNPDRVRQYVRHTLEVCRDNGCVLEMILKDTHTCDRHPERFEQWTQIARAEVQRVHS